MMKNLLKNFVILCAFLLGITEAKAQHICGFDLKHEQKMTTDDTYRLQYEKLEKEWTQYIADENNPKKMVIEGLDTIYEIPIVVHIIHTGGLPGTMYNRSDADIIGWVNYTNEIFAGTAPGYVGEGAGGTKIPVRLVLAQRDPDCNATTGIIRVNGSGVAGYTANGVSAGTIGVDELDIFALSRWDPNYYYNIYVVNKIDGEDGYSSSSYIAGYAYFPPASSIYDGSVMLSYIAESGESTFAHEFGHAMGLYHTFQGAATYTSCPPTEPGSTCSTINDRVCDTERGRALLGVFPCPTAASTNPCTSTFYAGVQYNVMNYSNCPNRFTPGQSERAILILTTYRNSLINSNATLPPGLETYDITPPSCIPTGISNPANLFASGPTLVEIADLSVTSNYYTPGSGNYYEDFTSDVNLCLNETATTELIKESTYTLSITLTLNTQNVKVYMDWDNDGIFSESTEVIANTSMSPGVNDVTFTVPATAVENEFIRMRIRTDVLSALPASACTNLVNGQTEDYAIKILPIPLSLEWKNFTAISSNCSIELNWDVQDVKSPIETIELQKSTDGRNYQTIENIFVGKYKDARKYVDNDALNGEFYYRLKITNGLGKVSYTHVEKIAGECSESFNIYPNPSNGTFTLQFTSTTSEPYTIQVYNVVGQMIYETEILASSGMNKTEIQLPSVPNGNYFVKLNNKNTIYKKSITIAN